MSEAPVPVVLAMLICDQIIIDGMSKKKSLIGLFDSINAVAFPSGMNCAVYAKLADAEGKYRIKLRFVDLKDESLLNELEVEATVKTQTAPTEIAINLMGIPIPAPGAYEFQLYANDIYLGRVKINAAQVVPGRPQWPQQ